MPALRPEQLAAHLEAPLAPLYLLHGDAPLLIEEAADAIRAAARRQGIGEREILISGQGFQWQQLALASGNLSLFGERKLILPAAEPGRAIRVNAGTYFIVSQYGDANAVVRAEVKVEAGKLSDAVVVHHAARVTLKLVNETGGEAMADTSWSVLTPEGDVVTESVGAFPTHILAEGTYTVIANHGGAAYSRQIEIKAGGDGEFEIMTGEKN